MPFVISAVTATRNRASFLPRCLESVTSQGYAHKEHVVIDGGSADGTKELLETAAAARSDLRWISEPDRGLSDAFNKGLALATGDCIGVIGDDDWYEPGAFETVAELFARHPEAGMVMGACHHVRNDGSVFWTQPARFTDRQQLIRCWKYWGRAVSIPAAATFIRREVIEAVGGFDEADKYAMDYRHWIKITEKFPVVVTTDKVLANFRCDAGSISFSQQDKQWLETVAISRDYWGSGASRLRMALAYAPYQMIFAIKAALRPLVRRLRGRR